MNALFLQVLNMSLSASWLVLAVLLFRLVLKKAPKWINVLLWGIVAVRMICPFTIESSFSLIPDSVGNGALVTNWINDYMGDIDIHHPASTTYDAAIGAGNEPVFDGKDGYYVVTKHDLLDGPATIENTVLPVLPIVWVVGMAVLALYTVISYWRLYHRLHTAVRYENSIFQSEHVNSPFVLGIIKPKIYLPFQMNRQDLEHVVAHEKAHMQRRDHLWKPIGFLLLTIHWFNPLMWLAYVLLCRDIELACDEKVIKELGNEQRADYTKALVACSVNYHVIAACPLSFGEIGVKKRVKSVMNYKKPAFWTIGISLITCIVVAVCFLTNPDKITSEPEIFESPGSSSTDEEAQQELPFSTTKADTWDFTDAASIQVVNGNNGDQSTFDKETAQSDFQNIIDLCQNLELLTDAEKIDRVGYRYCVMMYDEDGKTLRIITPYQDGYSINDTFYQYDDSNYDHDNNASIKLLNYLDLLFYPAEDETVIIENPLITTTEFTNPVNTLADMKILMEKYKSTEGDLEITNHSGKELIVGEQLDIQMKVNNRWYRIEQIYDALWKDVAYNLPDGQTTILTAQWSHIYGELPVGSYRIVKEVIDYLAPGDYDTYAIAAEFEIKESW